MNGDKFLWLALLVVMWTAQHAVAFIPPMHFYLDETQDTPPLVEQPETLTVPPHTADCYITVQVTKKIAGHCMGIGNRAKGCVSGSMLHPFHPDC